VSGRWATPVSKGARTRELLSNYTYATIIVGTANVIVSVDDSPDSANGPPNDVDRTSIGPDSNFVGFLFPGGLREFEHEMARRFDQFVHRAFSHSDDAAWLNAYRVARVVCDVACAIGAASCGPWP
jgi:hypothetical protein